MSMQYIEFFLDVKVKFSLTNFDIFNIIGQNITVNCWYPLEPPQCMFLIKIKKLRYNPAYPILLLKKWGIRGYTLHGHVFLMIVFEDKIRDKIR